jgi:threonine dehydratase
LQTIKNYPVSLLETLQARKVVGHYLKPTNLIHYANLSHHIGADIHIKHENHNPTRSFKIRGGINLMHHLAAHHIHDVITFSTGNHGLSIAASAKMLGIAATVVVPEGNNPVKNAMIEDLGAELVVGGKNFEEASKVVETICQEKESYYAHPANEPHLINGVGSEFLEILEDLPTIDAIILPVGAGSEVAAASIVFKALKPDVKIYAVQAESSQAAYLSWRDKTIRSASNTTFAGGFATGIGYELPFSIYKDSIDTFVLLTEEEIYQGIKYAKHCTKNIVEGAGASTLMAAIKLKDQLQGKKVVCQFSGANPTHEELEKSESFEIEKF